MYFTRQMRNYAVISKNFLNYLPSRIFVILNSFVIIPMFAYFLTTSEMSVFQISIGILNLICTCSTDWIAKSVLRFYEKFRLQENLDGFFSIIIFLTIVCYALILLIYTCFHNIVFEKFFIEPKIFLLTLLLIAPFGLRQLLYQLLRIFKKPFLYTVSIIIYQISLIILFLSFTNFFTNVTAILVAMAISAMLIDFIILKIIYCKHTFKFSFDKKILNEILIYAIPLVLTNSSIWLILHFNKFIFQFSQEFIYTAIAGISWLFVSNILTPVFSTLLFAVFPVIIKRFENTYSIKPFMTALLQIYSVIFLPFVGIFCFFSKDITKIVFPHEYSSIAILLPFSALTLFLHEFMKLINLKYHLQNKTYIETIISLIVASICVLLNLILIKHFDLLGMGVAMLLSMGILVVLNSFVKFKTFDYLNKKNFIQTFILSIIINLTSFATVAVIFYKQTDVFCVFSKLITFLVIYSALVFAFRKRIFVLT